jgi:hypothetical protein
MKKLLLIITLFFCKTFIAQINYNFLVSEIKKQHPQLELQNKLISVNVWSAENIESREANKAFQKTFTTYEFAKLKGGLKGVVCFLINKDNANESAIILNKDGIVKPIILKDLDPTLVSNLSNVVFDANGNEVYKNLPSSNVFKSFNQLITR